MKAKCSIHNHTRLSDGSLSPSQLLRHLKEKGYDVVAITDHNHLTLPHRLQMVDDILFINGVEWTFRWHIIKLSFPLDKVTPQNWKEHKDKAKVDFLAHPGRWNLSEKEIKEITSSFKLDGYEKYNRGKEQFNGEIEGLVEYATDDFHNKGMARESWVEMEVDSLNRENVLEKLKKSDFDLVV